MFRKKIAVSLLACAIVLTGSILPAPKASAATATSYSYCNIDGCYRTKNHKHNGVSYYGHTANDGHSYHSSGRGHRSGGCHR